MDLYRLVSGLKKLSPTMENRFAMVPPSAQQNPVVIELLPRPHPELGQQILHREVLSLLPFDVEDDPPRVHHEHAVA